MPTDIIMPQLGESIAEGTVVKWLIAPGGRVEKDQPLLEVETDKVALEIPSPAAGALTEVLVNEGETVPVGAVIARLEDAKADPGVPVGVVNRVGGVVVRPMVRAEEGGHYSPAVRQLAREQGVDLSQVTGTGAGGRVTRKDVLEFLAKQGTTPTFILPPQGGGTINIPSPGVPVAPQVATGHGEGAGEGEQVLPLTPMRKTIAERMVMSRRTSAHVVTFFEADFSGIAGFRQALRQGSGQGLTYLPFVIHAVTRAIKDVPMLNSSWSESGIVLSRDVHMGVAVALEDGLLVPVIRHAERKGLTQLGKEVADLAGRARTKKLSPEEVREGTFTITNHGGSGSLFSAPIINQPQIAILGVGAVQKRAVVINDAIAIRLMCYLSLSFDHRVIDGSTADHFMSKIKAYLEQSDWEKFL